MHELPDELTNSLRSWRGSVYGTSTRNGTIDAEKTELNSTDGESTSRGKTTFHNGTADYNDKEFEQALNNSSLVLHPTASRQALSQTTGSQDNHGQPQDQIEPLPRSHQGRGYGPTNAHLYPQTGAQSHLFSGPVIDDPDPAADRLDDNMNPLTKPDFYELMGMHPPVSKTQNPKELSSRNGLYGQIHYDLEYIQTKYRIYDILVYAFLVLQLFLSAVFIILGSLTHVDSHIAIAILGAVSTVIAGCLALMKGQGLPNRLRQTRDSLRNVIFAAEELYWDVGADRPVYYKDVKKIREEYLRVLEEARRNHPDTWNVEATSLAQGVLAGKGKHPNVAATAMSRLN